MSDLDRPVYYAAFFTIKFASLDEVRRDHADLLEKHLATARQLHEAGELLMAGAFVDEPGQPISSLAVLVSREAAENFIERDPFVQNGFVSEWHVREWRNMLWRP